MTEERDLDGQIRALAASDARFSDGAYHFVFEALDFTIRWLGRDRAEGTERHVGGKELLEGIRRYAMREFGPLSRVVFESWGIHRTRDFGEIVFRLVDAGLLSRQDSDSIEDFDGGFDFVAAFERGYAIETTDLRLS
ncbi:MAG: hypothetical protein JNJ88_10900 [Planctomycetes bacterium]|nr:hypothetical protein [Planctomycetota bacterium]